jgi:hypothetical protein
MPSDHSSGSLRASTVEERLNKLKPDERAHVEANSRWMPIYAWNKWVAHPSAPNGGFTVNKEFYHGLVEFMEDHRGFYYTPITANHDHAGKEPEREGRVPDSAKNFGRVITLRETTKGIEAYTYFARGVAQDYDDGYIDSISPTHYNEFHSNKTGKRYMTGLKEVSIVRIRHQKGLQGASPWYRLEEQEQSAVALTEIEESTDMSDKTPQAGAQGQNNAQVAPLTTESVTQIVKDQVKVQIAESLTPITTQLSEISEKLNPTGTVENKEADPTATQLSALERKLALYEARDRVRSAVPTLDDATVTSLSEAVMAAPKSFDAIVAPHKELATLKATQAAAGAGDKKPGAVALTEQGMSSGVAGVVQNGAGGKKPYSHYLALAHSAGITDPAQAAQWVRKNHPEAVQRS